MGVILFVVIALIGYFFSFLALVSAESVMHEILAGVIAIVSTLFIVCASLEQLNRTITKQKPIIEPELKSRIEELAADVAWFRERKVKEVQRENDARLSRAQK
jgi:hypothetical protein